VSVPSDAARTRTVLRARVDGRRDALEAEWGERPERPPRPAPDVDVNGPAPPDKVAFDRRAYRWRVDVVTTDDAGRVRLRTDGETPALPGGPATRRETLHEAAKRHAAPVAGDDAPVRDLLWTQHVEFDYSDVTYPALRAVVHVVATDPAPGAWVAPADLPDSLPDRDAIRETLRS